MPPSLLSTKPKLAWLLAPRFVSFLRRSLSVLHMRLIRYSLLPRAAFKHGTRYYLLSTLTLRLQLKIRQA